MTALVILGLVVVALVYPCFILSGEISEREEAEQ